MITFLVLCVLMVAIALAFVLPPLLQRGDKKELRGEDGSEQANLAVYRDQIAELDGDMEHGLIDREQHDQDRDELERRLLDDMATKDPDLSRQVIQSPDGRMYVYMIALGIPLLATALYLRVGHPSAMSASPTSTRIESAPTEEPAEPPADGQRSQQDIEANVAALAKRLQENPGTATLPEWIMLGNSYMSFKKYSEASAAYAKASSMKPDDASLLADYAYSLGMANGNQLQGQPLELINKALKLEPENPKALELAGNAAYQAQDYTRAITYWETLMRKLPPQSEVANLLTQRIEEAKLKAGSSK